MDCRVPVRQMIAVLARLGGGVQDRLGPPPAADHDALIDRSQLAVRPLLERDDDRGRRAVVAVLGQLRVEPAGGDSPRSELL